MKTNAYEIIIRPILTEKSLANIENKVFSFEVAKNANKTHVKLALEELYGVEIAKVNVINVKPRPRTVGRHSGYKRTFKKAMVTLKPDSKVFEGFDF